MQNTLDLFTFNSLIKKINIQAEWDRATYFKDVKLFKNSDDFTYENSGKDASGARFKKGVYRHTAIIDGDEIVLYIGKSQGLTSSIANRQTSHFRSFRFVDNMVERSGAKYRKLMEEYSFTELNVKIDYIDMTEYHSSIIAMFEELSIEHFSPLLNQ